MLTDFFEINKKLMDLELIPLTCFGYITSSFTKILLSDSPKRFTTNYKIKQMHRIEIEFIAFRKLYKFRNSVFLIKHNTYILIDSRTAYHLSFVCYKYDIRVITIMTIIITI